jgi:hypothetical protein
LDATTLQPPPRPISPRAARRAWGEPRVRLWWLAGVVILLIATFFIVSGMRAWMRDRALVVDGVVVQAIPSSPTGQGIEGHRLPADAVVRLTFEYNGKRREVQGQLAGRRDLIVLGAPVEIRIDPDNPQRWTGRQSPAPPWAYIVGSLPLLPLVVILFIAAFVIRRGVLHTWRDGEAKEAVVVEVRQSPLAPQSQIVRCALAGGDGRVWTVTQPKSAGRVLRGDPIWLIVPHKGKPIAAAAYS